MRLFVEQRHQVLGFVRAIVGDGDLAEDVLQDLAVLVMRKHGEIADEEVFPGWVRVAARFEALGQLRKRRQQPLDEHAIEVLTESWSSVPTAADEERFATLKRCLAQLTPTGQKLVELRYGRGLACDELARQLGRPLNTIYVGLTRVHRALAACIGGRT